MIGTKRRSPLAAVAKGRDRTRWETILGACSEAVAVVDGEGTVMLASAHMERELGSRTLVGASLVNLIHPDDYPDFVGTLVSFVADVGVVTWSDWRFRHADGGWVEMETTATNLLADPGVHGIVLTSRNVTERNATNRALEEARRRLEAVLDIAGAAIFVTELDGTIALANRACSTLFGLQPEEMLGRRAADLPARGGPPARGARPRGPTPGTRSSSTSSSRSAATTGTSCPRRCRSSTPTEAHRHLQRRHRHHRPRPCPTGEGGAQGGPGPLTADGGAGPARRRHRARLQQPARA